MEHYKNSHNNNNSVINEKILRIAMKKQPQTMNIYFNMDTNIQSKWSK